ncbi:MAG: ATP-binding cassette domain-containing protein [Nitrososphaerota archaeon]
MDAPLMVDESIRTPHDAIELVKKNVVDMFSVYVGKAGGIDGARKILTMAELFHYKNNTYIVGRFFSIRLKMVVVRLENLTKKFRDLVAVDNINLEIRDKEFFVFLGPSGSGKSTTLNMIAGLEEPTSGYIYFDDQVVNDIPPEKRDVAMVFQTFALYPHLNAFDNIAFPLKVRKYPKEEIRNKVLQVAEMLRIRYLLNKKPYEMSGGERQRVALARAIVREPRLFLLDEPLSNIDAKLRVYMRAELIRLQKDLGITTIYVTHDQVEAMTMGDRVAIMNWGKVMQIGSPIEVFKKPANLFVAGFIGTPPMNFFECSLKTNGKDIIDCGYFELSIDRAIADIVKNNSSGSELVLGIRPNELRVTNNKISEDSFEAEVFAVENLGTESIVNFKIGDAIYKAVVPGVIYYNFGQKIWITINKDSIHIFDKKSEKAII